MLAASIDRLLEDLSDDAVVLDIGGWIRPFTRADYVLDLMPYETRGPYGRDGPDPERFSQETWIERDICDREPYPFRDKEIDFVVCSHTLEDVRDPIFVCSEMIRIGKAGYIEVPSRLEEQSHGFQGPWVGWGHHRWLIDVRPEGIDFVFKHHILHGTDEDHFPLGFRDALTDEERVQMLWWEGSFAYRERVMVSADEIDPYLADFVTEALSAFSDRGSGSGSGPAASHARKKGRASACQ
jgi:methyltransferase family protein